MKKAIQKRYRLIRIHEVWHFPPEQHEWLQIKTEASGWPKEVCEDEVKREQFLREYKEREGIQLQREQIGKNSRRKATSKLMLKSFWGKSRERDNKPTTTQITSLQPLKSQVQILFDQTINLKTLRICNEDVLETVHENIQEDVKANPKINIFIAAFTTCWARLKLYSFLEHVGENALYHDADSVIYKWKPGLPEIPTGDR